MVEHCYRFLYCTGCGHRVSVPIYCGNRFCPICSTPRRRRSARRLNALIKKIRPRKPACLKMLTLTIPNTLDVGVGAQTIVQAFRRLRQRAYWRSHALGGAYVIEITGKPGSWHVHLHIALEAKFMSWRKLLQMWKAVSPGQGVYIQNIQSGPLTHYLTKYMTKPCIPEEYQQEVSDALTNFRLFQAFGSWHSVKVRISHPEFICPKCRNVSWLPEELVSKYSRQAARGP